MDGKHSASGAISLSAYCLNAALQLSFMCIVLLSNFALAAIVLLLGSTKVMSYLGPKPSSGLPICGHMSFTCLHYLYPALAMLYITPLFQMRANLACHWFCCACLRC